MHKVKLAAITCELPATSYANDDPVFDQVSDLQPTWWQFWGVDRRGYFDPRQGENEFTMAARAASRLLASSGTAPEAVDVLICSASCPVMTDAGEVLPGISGRLYPRLSNVLSKHLGLERALPLDSQMECSSFLLNLRLAASLIRQGKAETVLVVCSEYISNMLDFTSRSSTLFADGCAAALLTRSDSEADLLASSEHSDATFYEVATGRWRLPEKPAADARPRLLFSLLSDGQNKMQTFVPENVPLAVNRALEKAGLQASDIDHFVFHQPTPFLVNAWARGVGCRDDQYLLTMGETGVMISVAIPYTLAKALREEHIRPGDHVVMAGAATGWGFAAQVWRLDDVLVC
ncbi:3-oxoacyl-ACP synthase III family protein [Pseudomonas mangiferae]|uniref:3-oxoacyl-ACP synthase III family protein n=1 Tax=Pseudomonas mangiferae TaxID=2593654 RepID=A0A553H534_9PSED|nr:3-oxoacyl-ACP synthase III family protein [Pseudomonas mangiferae]TRX76856.1 3-oxoacyl-ACP synthase III family protein [Pseudomonas mangiferae]